MNLTDCARVLMYCEEHGSITAREAFINLEINSPRRVITELRRKGYIVKAVPMDNNGKKPYHRYYVLGKEGDADGGCKS